MISKRRKRDKSFWNLRFVCGRRVRIRNAYSCVQLSSDISIRKRTQRQWTCFFECIGCSKAASGFFLIAASLTALNLMRMLALSMCEWVRKREAHSAKWKHKFWIFMDVRSVCELVWRLKTMLHVFQSIVKFGWSTFIVHVNVVTIYVSIVISLFYASIVKKTKLFSHAKKW